MDFSGFNWGEVFVAAASAFVLGFFWYSKWLFGKPWQRINGFSDEELRKGNPLIIFGLGYVLAFVLALGLGALLEVVSLLGANFGLGALFGLLFGLVFVLTTFGINYLFSRRSLKLYLIDAGYMWLVFALMGGIMGAWK